MQCVFSDVLARIGEKDLKVPGVRFVRRGVSIHSPVMWLDKGQDGVLVRPQFVVSATATGQAFGYVLGDFDEALQTAAEIAYHNGLGIETSTYEYLCNGSALRSQIARMYIDRKLVDGPVWQCEDPSGVFQEYASRGGCKGIPIRHPIERYKWERDVVQGR